eukprot:gnl/MRDRNA2_/MRDRNA2_30042_c0_seq1.p1 gnl/MRDRNA2_/MRDRNA2_30042_c0~~gnl/MRDRNA2_/MRDRNA2_30042_c0_seq1.p1  ORF type:complete len:2129 (-),score=441.85 gnl/MRDRNA2_/MRDRNA2_30042_c0_seq1:27-5600(-)
MAERPHLDLNQVSFVDAYSSAIALMSERADLLRKIVDHQIQTEKRLAAQMGEHQLRLGRLKARSVHETTDEEEHDVENMEGAESLTEDPQLALGHGLSNPFEGCPHPDTEEEMVRFVPSGNKTGLFEFSRSACLCWKVDLLAMDAHKHLVEHLHPEQQQVPALQRACYLIMAEEWTRYTRDSLVHFMAPSTASGDVLNFGAMAEDPAQLGHILETSIEQLRTSYFASSSHKHASFAKSASATSAVEGADETEESVEEQDAPSLDQIFADLLERPPDEMALRMYINLLEHVRVREWLSDSALENRALEAVLEEQSKTVGSSVILRTDPVPEFAEFPSEPTTSKDRATPDFLAGDVDEEFGNIDFSSEAGIVKNCSNPRIREMRMIYQHELANRWLYVTCVVNNAIIIDEPIRKQILRDVSSREPSVTLMNSDRQILILKRLRHSSDMSIANLPDAQPMLVREQPGENDSGSSLKVTPELSKVSFFCTYPVANKGMVRIGIGNLIRERSGMVKKRMANLPKHEAALWLRQYKLRLLNYCNVFICQATCDISVRVQAALLALQFRSMASLIPVEFTPFVCSTDQSPKPFLDREGAVSSLFFLPQAVEVLQMRGTSIKCADVTRGILEVDAKLPDAFDTTKISQSTDVARLETDYRGAAFLVLVLLHNFLPLVSLLYFFSALEGNQSVLLRLHHAVKSSLSDPESVKRAAAETLAHPGGDVKTTSEITWEALENLRVEFMNFQEQLKGKEANPSAMLALLHRRLKCSYFKVSLLLQKSAHEALSQGAYSDLAILQGWMRYLDGCSIEGGGEMIVAGLLSGGIQESSTFQDSAEEAGADEALRRITMLAPPGEPDVAGLRMDFNRYLAEVKAPTPDLPYLHPYIHALMTVHAKDNLQREEDPDIEQGTDYLSVATAPPPFKGRLPWSFPQAPLLHLTRACCLLSNKHWGSVSRNHIRLEMKAEEYFLLREVSVASPASLEAETELYRTLMVREILKDCVLSAHLRSVAPAASNPQELAQFDAHFSKVFAMERMGDSGGGGGGDAQDAGGPAQGNGKAAVKSSAEDRARAAIRMEMRAAYEQITRLISVFCKMLLGFSHSACQRQLEVVTLAMEERDQAKSSPSMGKEARGGSGGVSKVDAALTFVNRLRARGTHVRTHGKGESQRAYVFTERDIDEVVEELGRRLLTWGHKAVVGQQGQAQTRIAQLRNQVQSLEQRVSQNALDQQCQKAWVERQIGTTVADRNHKLVFEVDRLHRVAEELMSASREMEFRLNSEIRFDVLAELDLLDKEVNQAQDCYYDYRVDLHTEIKEELKAIRGDIIAQLQQMGVTNFVLQQKVKLFQDDARKEDEKEKEEKSGGTSLPLGKNKKKAEEEKPPPVAVAPVSTKQLGEDPDDKKKIRPDVTIPGGEDGFSESVEGLLDTINELKYMQVRCRTFQKLKFQTLRQQFEQLIQALAMTLSSNSELWERVSEIRERERLVEDELTRSLQQKQNHEGTLDRLNEQVDFNNDQRQKLQAWRKGKENRLDALEAEVKKYSRLGSINIERLILELNKRDASLRALDSGSVTTDDRIFAESMKASKQQRELAKKIKEVKQHAAKAEAKVELMRSELERGGMEQDSLVMLWHERWCETTKRAADVEAENAELKSRNKSKRGAMQPVAMQGISRELDLPWLSSPTGAQPAGGGESRSQQHFPHATEFEEHAAFAVGLSVVQRPPLQRRQIDQASTIIAPPPLKRSPQIGSPGKLKREDIMAVNESIRDLTGRPSPKSSPVINRGERVAQAHARSSPRASSARAASAAQEADSSDVRPTYGLSGHGARLVPQLLPKKPGSTQERKRGEERASLKRSGTFAVPSNPSRRSVG